MLLSKNITLKHTLSFPPSLLVLSICHIQLSTNFPLDPYLRLKSHKKSTRLRIEFAANYRLKISTLTLTSKIIWVLLPLSANTKLDLLQVILKYLAWGKISLVIPRGFNYLHTQNRYSIVTFFKSAVCSW